MILEELIKEAKSALAKEKDGPRLVGASYFMRKFNLGLIRAQELIGELQHAKVIGQANPAGKFEIL